MSLMLYKHSQHIGERRTSVTHDLVCRGKREAAAAGGHVSVANGSVLIRLKSLSLVGKKLYGKANSCVFYINYATRIPWIRFHRMVASCVPAGAVDVASDRQARGSSV